MWRKYDSAEEAEYISKAGRYIMKKAKSTSSKYKKTEAHIVTIITMCFRQGSKRIRRRKDEKEKEQKKKEKEEEDLLFLLHLHRRQQQRLEGGKRRRRSCSSERGDARGGR